MLMKRRRIRTAGEMAEWLKAHAWKACIGETLSRVRIPVSPPAHPSRLLRACESGAHLELARQGQAIPDGCHAQRDALIGVEFLVQRADGQSIGIAGCGIDHRSAPKHVINCN